MSGVTDHLHLEHLRAAHARGCWRQWNQVLGLEKRWHETTTPAAAPAPAERQQPRLRESVLLITMEGGACGAVAQALGRSGYDVRTVEGVSHALDSFAVQQPLLVIICGRHVRKACFAVRRVTSAPILALLSQPTEAEVIEALDAGADDCQSVTIGVNQIRLRVRALLRRGNTVSGDSS